MTSLSVVVSVRDDPPIFGAVESILASADNPSDLEVIVVDNGSLPEFRSQLDALRGQVMLVDEPAPGVSNARNAGVAASTGEVVVFTDADCVAHPGWAREVLAGMAATGADLVMGSTGVASTTRASAIIEAVEQSWEDSRGDYVHIDGKNLAVRREVFQKVRFDPAYLRHEDFLFGRQATDAGFSRAYWTPMRVDHHHDETLRLHLAKQVVDGWAKTAMRQRFGWQNTVARRKRTQFRGLRGLVVKLGLQRPVACAWASVALGCGWALERSAPPLPMAFGFRALLFLIALCHGCGAFMQRAGLPQPTVGEVLGRRGP